MSAALTDAGHSVERARSILRASQALLVGARPGERRPWENRERYWKIQLAFAEAREAATPTQEDK